MSDSAFVSADIEKLVQFEKDSAEVIAEFSRIKTDFERINSDLLNKWKGKGATAYKEETDHILENIGGIEDVLKRINESAYRDIKDGYLKLDNELDTYNRSKLGE